MLDAQQLQSMEKQGKLTKAQTISAKKRLAKKVIGKEKVRNAKNGIIYILLAFFVGTLGLHNFYARYWGRGASQLILTLLAPWFLYITLLFVSIWVLLELLFVNRDAQGCRFAGNRVIINLLRGGTILIMVLAFSYSPLVVNEPDFVGLVTEM